MKLKTQEEIIKLSEVKYPIAPMSNTHEIDLIHHKRIGYQEAYSQAQQDLSEQASEGFEEWEKREHPGRQYGHDWQNDEEGAWQASRLSHAKKDQDKDALIEKLEKELEQQKFNNAHNLSIDQQIADKIESLKSDLDWITLNCKSGTEYSEFVFNYKMKEIRQRHCLDKSEGV